MGIGRAMAVITGTTHSGHSAIAVACKQPRLLIGTKAPLPLNGSLVLAIGFSLISSSYPPLYLFSLFISVCIVYMLIYSVCDPKLGSLRCFGRFVNQGSVSVYEMAFTLAFKTILRVPFEILVASWRFVVGCWGT